MPVEVVRYQKAMNLDYAVKLDWASPKIESLVERVEGCSGSSTERDEQDEIPMPH